MDTQGATAPTMPPPLPVRPLGPAVLGFVIDLIAVLATAIVLSALLGAAWVVWSALSAAAGDLDRFAELVKQAPPPDGIVLVWITLLAMLPTAVLFYFLRARATRAERAASHAALARPATWGWMLITSLAVLALSYGIGWIGDRLGSTPVPTNVALVEKAFDESPLFLIAFTVLLAPLYEELLFRRVLFGRLWRAGRPGLGLLLSSAAFALVHELPGMSTNPWPAMLQLWLVYGAMGATFAWVYRRTGTLWAAIGAHALNNAFACALLLSGHG